MMTNEQLIGVVLLVFGGGLFVWSVWPTLAKWLIKPSPKKWDRETLERIQEAFSDKTANDVSKAEWVGDWAKLHTKVAELSTLIEANKPAKAKLNELGQLLYDPKNWETQDNDS